MKLEIGEFEIWTLETGNFKLDGGAMFGHVPKTLWEKKINPDADNRIPLNLRCLLLRTPQFTALVDAGMGEKWGAKGSDLFDLQSQSSWEDLLLEAAGITPRDINHVIVTHLHFDHAGGLTAFSEDEQSLRPCFKNAQHWISKANYMNASDPSPREKASYRSENWEVLFDRRQVELVEQDLREEPRQILPGVFVERSDGHTVGQQIVHIQPQGHKGLVFAADLLPTHHHIKESWGMGYDSQPLLVLEEKKELLRRAAHHDWNIILEHDSQKEMIQIEEQKSIRGGVEFLTRP